MQSNLRFSSHLKLKILNDKRQSITLFVWRGCADQRIKEEDDRREGWLRVDSVREVEHCREIDKLVAESCNGKNNVDPHSAVRDRHPRETSKVRARRRARTWHLIPLYPSSRFVDEVDRRQRASGATGNTPTLLVLRLVSPSSSRASRPRRCCSLSSSTPRLTEKSHRRETVLDFHTSLRPLCSPLFTTILALYYQIYYCYYCYHCITTTTILPLLCSWTCTRCPGERWTADLSAGKPRKRRGRGVRRKLSEIPEGTNSPLQNYI